MLIPYAALVTREFDPDSLKAKSETTPMSGSISSKPMPPKHPRSKDDTSKRKKSAKIKKSGIFVIRDGKAKLR